MARRRSIRAPLAGESDVQVGSRRTRIRIPQTPLRPLLIRDTRKRELIRPPSPPEMVIHRRGVARPRVGVDPLEARAIPESRVRGFLHERILYLYLVKDLRLVDGIDFSYQSAKDGGRLELGGLVVDFVFPLMHFVIQVQGPRHETLLGQRKDEEQAQILAALGYPVVYYIDLRVIEDAQRLDEAMKRIWGIWGTVGGSQPSSISPTISDDLTQTQVDRLYSGLSDMEQWLAVLV